VSTIKETLAQLGLSANPFDKDTPLDSLFSGGMRRASLDQLQLLSRESGDIIALIGADGCGKSILADFYARRSERDQIVASTRASMLTSPAQLLQEMFKAFVLDFPPQASLNELRARLLAYFKAVQEKSRNVVLIVDDAHELGDDAFSLLAKLALVDNPDNTFHLILVGQSALLDMLDYTCPQQHGHNQFTSIRLPEFSLDETRNYLRYRLNAVGFSEQDPARPLPFSNRQVEKIHKLSGGVPGQINEIASAMLLAHGSGLSAWLEPLQKLTIPPKYAYAAGGLSIVLLLAFLVGGGDEAPEVAQRQIVVPVPVREIGDAVAVDESPAQSASSPFADAATPDAGLEPAVEPAAITPEPVIAAVGDDDGLSAPPASTPSIAEPVPSISEPEATTTPSPAASVASSPAPALPAVAASAGQTQQVLDLPGNRYTVQLLGAASRANVEAFVQRNADAPLYWFESENQGRAWYVVIHGSYASRAAAQTAANALIGELGSLQPWIRSLAAVHRDIDTSN